MQAAKKGKVNPAEEEKAKKRKDLKRMKGRNLQRSLNKKTL